MSTIGGTVTHGVTITTNGAYRSPLTVGRGGYVDLATGNAIYGPGSQAWTVINDGTIVSETADGVALAAGGSVGNIGEIQGQGNGVHIFGAPGTVENSGTIGSAYGYGVWLYAGGSVSNDGGLIEAPDASGVRITGGVGTVSNTGTILGGTITPGVYLGAGGTVINTAGLILGAQGVALQAAGTVINSGTIVGTSSSGVQLGNGGTVVDTGTIAGNVNAVLFHGTVANRLVLEAGYKLVGVVAGSTGNGATNTLELGSAGGAGTVSAALQTEFQHFGTIAIDGGADWTLTGNSKLAAGVTLTDSGTLINAGTLGGAGGTNGTGALVDAGTLVNSGSIGLGLTLATGAYLDNTGTISGVNAVTGAGGAVSIVNAGTIVGTNDAVLLGDGNDRLTVDPGAVFIGAVDGGGGSNLLELASSAGAGTLGGLGSKYIGFGTVTIDSGATWDIAGTLAGIGASTIVGFNSHDTLDLTDLTFSAGDSVMLDDATDVLTISDSSAHVLGTVHLAGDFTGALFHLASDGANGTYITEDTAPCYCRGTRIRTADGEVTVETLRIGDSILTADGEILPLKWIGRRSYRDWLAVGSAEVQPILFKAGSIADHVPARDLYVSPEHAMFIDGMLVPAQHLVNGVSILKMQGLEAVDYFHLEFDRHVVIFAEGAAAESFVDDDSRMLFHNAGEYRRLYPDEPRRQAEFCAPRVESGFVLDALRLRLHDRAGRLRPDGTASPAPLRRGFADRASRSAVEGWALAEDGPAVLRPRPGANQPSSFLRA